MKTLYLNRHAKSSWKQPYSRDFDRVLNKRGRINAKFMAERYALEETADLIITSPAARARATAQEFVKALAEVEYIEESSVYGASIDEMIRLIQSIDRQHSNVILFGHNPTFTDLAHYLDHGYKDHMVTCARVCIDFDVDDWQMVSRDLGTVRYHDYPRRYPEMEHL